MPPYLWDIRDKKTQVVDALNATLGRCPDYAAFSHTVSSNLSLSSDIPARLRLCSNQIDSLLQNAFKTDINFPQWGRWRKHDEPIIAIPGVPWRVPQNKRFEVNQLPQILEKLPYRYVWLDLLTIPQECSTPRLHEIQQQEIAKQAAIFRGADIAIAWLNDISDWNVLPSVIRYLSYTHSMGSFVQRTSDNERRRIKLCSLVLDVAAALDAHIELFQFCDSNLKDRCDRGPNSWFTSLWTLQESLPKA